MPNKSEAQAQVIEHPTVSISTEIAEYTPIAAALAELRNRYENVAYDVSTTTGIDEARKARAEIREYRYSLEKKRKELKAEVLERGRKIDSVAAEIRTALEKLEEPIDQQIKAEEARKEAEKQAKAEAEAERIERIHSSINFLRNMGIPNPTWTAAQILNAAETVKCLAIDENKHEEFYELALSVRTSAYQSLIAAHAAKLAQEEEQAKIAAERAELERLRKEAEEREAEIQRMRAEADAARKKEEERIAAERKAEEDRVAAERAAEAARVKAERDAELAKQAEERARIASEEAEAKRKQAEEQARIDAENAKIAAEKRAIEEEKARQAAEAKRLKEHKKRLAAEKVESPAHALAKIYDLCEDYDGHPDHEWVRRDVAIIAEANLPAEEV